MSGNIITAWNSTIHFNRFHDTFSVLLPSHPYKTRNNWLWIKDLKILNIFIIRQKKNTFSSRKIVNKFDDFLKNPTLVMILTDSPNEKRNKTILVSSSRYLWGYSTRDSVVDPSLTWCICNTYTRAQFRLTCTLRVHWFSVVT